MRLPSYLIRCSNQYIPRKSFAVWNYYKKKKKLNTAKYILDKELVFLDPSLSCIFFRVVSICESLRKLVVMHIEKREIHDMRDFRKRQEQLRHVASEKKIQLISELARFVCIHGEKEIFKAIGIDTSVRKNAMEVPSTHDPNQSFLTLDPIVLQSSQDNISSSILSSSIQQPLNSSKANDHLNMTFSDKSVVRQISRRLYGLLRLADFMLRDAMYEVFSHKVIIFLC